VILLNRDAKFGLVSDDRRPKGKLGDAAAKFNLDLLLLIVSDLKTNCECGFVVESIEWRL